MAFQFQRIIFELARSDPRWTSPSKFDYEGAPQTYYILKCSMMHFDDGDHVNGGRMLRKAFVTLEQELSDWSLTVVQDVCLNILGITLRYDYAEIGTRMLRHCGHLFGLKHHNRLYCIFFESLAHAFAFCQDMAHSDYHLRKLTGLYANELDHVRSCSDRGSIQANRRYRLIEWNSEDKEAAKEIISRSECLLTEAVSELEDLDDKRLRIQNEALRMQSYFHDYQDDYIDKIRRPENELKKHYASKQKVIPFESWEQSHQFAFLRLWERELDYYKDMKDLDRAAEAASRVLKLEKNQTERWIMVSLQFEFWLRKMGQKRKGARIKEERLRSGYYSRLEESFP
ncbi:hypothetical protein GQ607_008188 [Colletotrichum asianum]|uniref:Uncharacterized protein n=1 Tax=Colletotrichum asianum TaxID=702518 RepID=A0A8H3WCG0_9PEZI|nr:hypothetical protein GQ607_008188 [Colletotrichum asianum]